MTLGEFLLKPMFIKRKLRSNSEKRSKNQYFNRERVLTPKNELQNYL